MATLDVDPDVLRGRGGALVTLAGQFPVAVQASGADCGAPDVDAALADVATWIQASWQCLVDETSALGATLNGAADSYASADASAEAAATTASGGGNGPL